MDRGFLDRLAGQTDELKGAGLFKPERVLSSPQQPVVRLADGREVINFCANNYLGLANHPRSIEAAHEALDRYGYGMASVRFICGTQDVHKQLEARLSAFLGTDDTILYSSCFDANGGLFETLLGEEDAVISDELNHASIIDGIRLCKAQRFRYANNDMADLEARLQGSRRRALQADRHRRRVLDGRRHRQPAGDLRPRRPVRRAGDGRRLARDRASSARRGRGTPEHCGVHGPGRHPHRHARQGAGRRVRRLHRGAQGDRRAAAAALAAVPVLQHARRRRSRPARCACSTCSRTATELRDQLRRNAAHFRAAHERRRLHARAGRAPDHPGDARRRARWPAQMAERLLARGHLRDRLLVSRWCRRARRASARR